MKENNEITNQMASEILTWMKSSKDFVVDQMPLLSQEILSSGRIYHWMLTVSLCIIWIFIAFVVVLFYRVTFKNTRYKPTEKDKDDFIIFSFVLAAINFLLLIPIGCNIYWICITYYAPRVYILESIRDFVK